MDLQWNQFFFLSVASSFEISVVCFNNLNKVTDIFVYELIMYHIFDPFLYHSQFGLQTIMHVAIAWILCSESGECQHLSNQVGIFRLCFKVHFQYR